MKELHDRGSLLTRGDMIADDGNSSVKMHVAGDVMLDDEQRIGSRLLQKAISKPVNPKDKTRTNSRSSDYSMCWLRTRRALTVAVVEGPTSNANE